jgi:hypothetical protein
MNTRNSKEPSNRDAERLGEDSSLSDRVVAEFRRERDMLERVESGTDAWYVRMMLPIALLWAAWGIYYYLEHGHFGHGRERHETGILFLVILLTMRVRAAFRKKH